MAARNSANSFGWISRALHWLMALGILSTLALGSFIENMQPSLSNLWLFGLHKTIGVTLFAAILLRLLWHWISPPPGPITQGIPNWQITASHITHRALYVLMVAIPLTGWIASAATGIDVVIFNTLTLPTPVPASETIENIFFLLHGVLTKLLMFCILLHIAGTLQRQFLRRDQTLRRMTRG